MRADQSSSYPRFLRTCNPGVCISRRLQSPKILGLITDPCAGRLGAEICRYCKVARILPYITNGRVPSWRDWWFKQPFDQKKCPDNNVPHGLWIECRRWKADTERSSPLKMWYQVSHQVNHRYISE